MQDLYKQKTRCVCDNDASVWQIIRLGCQKLLYEKQDVFTKYIHVEIFQKKVKPKMKVTSSNILFT